MAPYLVPEVINHSPAILPLGVFLHHNIADRRTVNITWSAHHREESYPLLPKRRNHGIAGSPSKKIQVYWYEEQRKMDSANGESVKEIEE
ncbi:hypothetical protein CAJAP_07020 [Camponotus japonicus]